MKSVFRTITAAVTAAAAFAAAALTASAFSDVEDSAWYKSAVDYVTENKYFLGISETEFAPFENMTRAMFVTVMARMADADTSSYTVSEFSDVEEEMWYTPYIGWAHAEGVAKGFEDGSFFPDEPVTMEQAAVFIMRYADKFGAEIKPGETEEFADEGDVSEWAKESVDRLHAAGVFCGDRKNKFTPHRPAERADIAAAITNLFTDAGIIRISKAETALESMTQEEKVYQMFIVRPESITGVETAIMAGDATAEALKRYPVGGVIYSASNLKDTVQTETMIANTQNYSKTGLFISVDEEGGAVARVAKTLGTTAFSPMYSYKDKGADTAKYIYKTIAGDIGKLGFNLDFAPVADVWTNPANKVIGTRAFSDNAYQAAPLVAAGVAGLQENGICATIKHFPGHGNTAGDSHTAKVYSYRTLAELESCEFIPFKAGIDAGVEFVMAGHITVPSVDSLPATLSYRWITDILRGQLGFDGIVITDGMEMGAIAKNYTSADAAIMAIEAGCDVILEPDTFTEAASAVINAVKSGRISEERIDESVMRILECKEKYNIL